MSPFLAHPIQYAVKLCNNWAEKAGSKTREDKRCSYATRISTRVVGSGVFREEGARCDAPLGPTMKIFYKRLHMKRCIFCHFPARIAKFNNVWWSSAFPNFRKMGELAVSIVHSEAKCFSFKGGGLRPQTPVIGSRYARSPCPLCQILNTPLVVGV